MRLPSGLWWMQPKVIPRAYEASLRVPLVIAGPGIEGGRVSDSLVELIDLNPTICQLAGLPPQGGIDGLSHLRIDDLHLHPVFLKYSARS